MTEQGGNSAESQGQDPVAAASAWRVWPLVILALVLLDSTFNVWFWQIPKLTSSSDDYAYAFLQNIERLRDSKEPNEKRALAFGSSVTSIFDPFQIQGLVDAADPPVPIEVNRIYSPGMKPSDYRLVFRSELDRIRPDVLIAPLNFVDFRNPSFERDVKEHSQQILPPWETIRERNPYLSMTSRLELLLAQVSNLYRYRKPLRTTLEDHARFMLKWLTGPSPGTAYGIYSDGYTAPEFALPIASSDSAFEYFVDPAWIEQRGSVRLSFEIDGQGIETAVHTTPGWKSLDFQDRGGEGAQLRVVADGPWVARASNKGTDARLLGVRLKADVPETGKAPVRYPPWRPQELKPFLRMGQSVGNEFQETWTRTMGADTPFGRRFKKYRQDRLSMRDVPFEPVSEFDQLQQLVRELREQGVSVVLVNTPESPDMLAEYESGPFYTGYLRFMQELADSDPGVGFYDLRHALPHEDFNDWHHVNYVGGIKLGPVFAKIVLEWALDPPGNSGTD